jgi:hypothetical protein
MVDWAIESSRMAMIYSKAFLTIAATGASDSSVGCFFPRSTKRHPKRDERENILRFSFDPIKIRRLVGGKDHAVYIRTAPTESHDQLLTADGSEATCPAHQAPLLSRAWAFQERFLSPRVLHFHTEEMMWQSRQQYACECGLMQHKCFSKRDNTQVVDPLIDIWKTSVSANSLLSLWYKIVDYYCQLSLTYDSDRLPALSGIVSVLSTRLNSSYHAGLWKLDFLRGLLWATTASDTVHTIRIKDYSVPTWSWASVKVAKLNEPGPIINEINPEFIPYFRTCVVGIHCPLTDKNLYGNVTQGAVTIEGPTVLVKFAAIGKDWDVDTISMGGIEYIGDDIKYLYESADVYIDIIGPQNLRDEVSTGDSFLALQLGRLESRHDYALVLKKGPSNSYGRVALMRIYCGGWFDSAKLTIVTIL